MGRVAVLGLDVCRAGWVGIVLGPDGPDDPDGRIEGVYGSDIAAAVSRVRVELSAVGVDMPIGLPDAGVRAADALARRAVGPRWPSVFLTPVRAAVQEGDYGAALERSRQRAGAGVSRQSYALRTRILEVDAWIGAAGLPVVEVHPELSFATMAGAPLGAGKKTWAGAARRRALLAAAGIVLPEDLGVAGEQAGVDDVLDAAAAAWSARRYAAGEARSYPDPPEVFSDGWPAAIWA